MNMPAVRRLSLMLLGWAFAAHVCAAPSLQPCPSTVIAPQAVLDAINLVRARGAHCGSATEPAAAPLVWNQRLADAASMYATDIAVRDAVTHDGKGGESLPQRLQRVGYRYSMAGENLAAGQESIDEAVAAWVRSPSHCKNVMMPWFSEVGLACVVRPGTRYVTYWVAHFGTEFKE